LCHDRSRPLLFVTRWVFIKTHSNAQ
jgi:hypothetical protein